MQKIASTTFHRKTYFASFWEFVYNVLLNTVVSTTIDDTVT